MLGPVPAAPLYVLIGTGVGVLVWLLRALYHIADPRG